MKKNNEKTSLKVYFFLLTNSKYLDFFMIFFDAYLVQNYLIVTSLTLPTNYNKYFSVQYF